MKKIAESSRLWIYGAHQIARDFYLYLRFHQAEGKASGFIVTEKKGNPASIEGLPVIALAAMEDVERESLVVIATPEKFHAEIRTALEAAGFRNVIGLGNKSLAKLENVDVIKYISLHFPGLEARQSAHDYMCVSLKTAEGLMNLMPLGAYPLSRKSKLVLSSLAGGDTIGRGFEQIGKCGIEVDAKQADAHLEVAVVSSMKDVAQNSVAYQSWEIPFIVGKVPEGFTKPSGTWMDCEGDNISEKNSLYAEATGTYWVWKNSRAAYKGISHYRRRYILSGTALSAIASGQVDVIATTPRLVLPELAEWFVAVSKLGLAEIACLAEAVEECFPGEGELFRKFLHGNVLLPNNMVIARSHIYDAYCNWLFRICEKIETEAKYVDILNCQRGIAYCAELLTSFYYMEKGNNESFCLYVPYMLS